MNMSHRPVNFHTLKTRVTAKDANYFRTLPNPEVVLDFLQCAHSKDTLLHIMCRHGCDEILHYFVKELGADMEVSNKDGKRPIHEAAQFSQEKCLQILLENGAQIDPLKRADWTPLMLACTKQSFTVVSCLLKAGADPLLRNKDGWNSFHIACREGHLDIIQSLNAHSPLVSCTKSNNLRTPLHSSALHGHPEVVRWLLDSCDCDPSVQDSCGVTPLMDALRAGYVDTAKVLMDAFELKVSSLLATEDKMGRQAIHHAAQSGQLAALYFLINECKISPCVQSKFSGETPLHTAAQEGQTEVLTSLLSFGADVNAQDRRGRSALHKASGGQHLECAKTLLLHGALPLTDMGGLTPQQLARKSEVVQIFKEHALLE